jgi:tetratricopeptide (TPR) repeat protein
VVPRAQQVSLNLNREARACVERGDHREAARLLKEAVAACPILEQNLNDLGAVLWTLGERDTAFECFTRAVKLNPDYAQARANLVDAAQLLDREAEADKLLTSISSLGQVLRP